MSFFFSFETYSLSCTEDLCIEIPDSVFELFEVLCMHDLDTP